MPKPGMRLVWGRILDQFLARPHPKRTRAGAKARTQGRPAERGWARRYPSLPGPRMSGPAPARSGQPVGHSTSVWTRRVPLYTHTMERYSRTRPSTVSSAGSVSPAVPARSTANEPITFPYMQARLREGRSVLAGRCQMPHHSPRRTRRRPRWDPPPRPAGRRAAGTPGRR